MKDNKMKNEQEKKEIYNFTMPPKRWFENYFGFVPEQEELAELIAREPGTYDLFRKIFSESYLVNEQIKEMGKNNG